MLISQIQRFPLLLLKIVTDFASYAKSVNIFQQKQKQNHYRQFSFSVPKSDLLMKSLTLQCYE